jgi:hypothetical protein
VDNESRAINRYRTKREERVAAALDQSQTHTRQFAAAVAELQGAVAEERALEQRREPLERRRDQLSARIEKRQAKIDKWQGERDKLQARTEIVEADVTQDTLFTVMKLTLGMLIHFIAVEYFAHRPIEWATFLARIATLPGRRETTADCITVYIYGNRRDIELMRALHGACCNINKRQLTKDGKRLRYAVEWPDGAPEQWAE